MNIQFRRNGIEARAAASLDTAHAKVHQRILCQLVDFTHMAESPVFKETVCCMVILS